MHKKIEVDFLNKHASILAIIFVAIIIGYVYQGAMVPRKDFYNELWAPAYLLVHQQSPYNTAVLNPELPAAWLPMAIGFFFPLGWLSEELALKCWYVFSILVICLIIYFVQEKKRNLYNSIALLLICFFSPYTFIHLVLGQFSIIATFSWVMAIYFLEKGRHGLVAFFVALALSKPHLGLLAVLGFSYYYFQQTGIRAVFSFYLRILFFCLLLCLPLFVAYPNWIPDAIRSMQANPAWMYPSLFVLFKRFLGIWGYVLWGLTTVTIVLINFWLWKKFPMKSATYWSLALMLLVTPYLGGWDFVVFFPLVILTYININWKSKIYFWLATICTWGGMVVSQILGDGYNYFFWWVPVWLIGCLAFLTNWKIQREA